MTVYPAIDLLDGRVVRLHQGAFDAVTEYGDDPIAVARGFAEAGASWIHVVDLNGAKEGVRRHGEVIGAIAAETGLRVQTGGGLRTREAVELALARGASRCVVGTALTGDPETAQALFGEYEGRIAAGLDARDGFLAVRGWVEKTDVSVFEFAERLRDWGCAWVVYTDVARDGALTGVDSEGLTRLAAIEGLNVIASGGVAGMDDLPKVRASGAEGVIVGRAVYEGRFDLAAAVQGESRTGETSTGGGR